MADEFDYVVVGGGSAGAVVAARLSEDPTVSVCLLEWGPTDVGNDDVLQIRRWLGLLEGPLDLAYRTTLQPRGNAHIVHSRAKVLGGCSSHNTMIWFKPFPGDWQDWVDAGASGWGPDDDGAVLRPHPRAALDRRPRRIATRSSTTGSRPAAIALGVDRSTDWNAAPFPDGAGFLDVGYDDATGVRSSSSVMYLHPILGQSSQPRRCRPSPRAVRLEFCRQARDRRARAARRRPHRPGRGASARSSSPAARSTRRGCCCTRASDRASSSSTSASTWSHDLPGRRREPDRPPRVDHHLEAEAADGARRRDGRRLRAVRQPPRRGRPARPDVPHLPAAVHVQHRAARATRCPTTAGASA